MKQLLTPAQKVARADQNHMLSALRKADHALTWLADSIHALPYRAVAWCRKLPARIAICKPKVLAWMEKKGITPRLKVFVPLALAGLILPFCLADIEFTDAIYLLEQGEGPKIVKDMPDFNAEMAFLSINNDASGRDAQMILTEGQQVTVNCGGETVTATARHETVANLLRRLDFTCSSDDMVVLDFTGEQLHISLQNEYTFDHDIALTAAFATERIPDPLMEKGTEEIVIPGKTGTVIKTYREIFRKGKLVRVDLVDTKTTDAVTQVIKYGTRVQEVSRDDRIESVHYNDDGSGYLLFQSGDTMTFSSQVTCNATAYSIGSWTASGLPTKVGHIAVDPTVFPYHTRFYIYTNDGYLVYGNAVAADCGTSIKGYKIDLWFETFDEACWFGRRDCTVFVLN